MNHDEEVAQRLAELRDHPQLLQRWDLDRDGQIDDGEWALVERIVRLEVETAHRRNTQWSLNFEPQVLRGRYEVVGLLGRGGQAKSFLARDLERDGQHVVAKVLEIEVASDWKSVELFEREAQVLEQLEHAHIPSYIDHFHEGAGENVQFVVVQQFIDGDDLSVPLSTGRLWTHKQAIRRLTELAEILVYLHGRNPPVVHRDIKPSNIIVARDDELYLIDFGAAQNIIPATAGGSTVIGTSGYVAMEQYMGRASPASDIYGLGATALHMMTGVHPADQEFQRGRLTTKNIENQGLRRMLDDMLEPHVEDRIPDARALLARLEALTTPERALVATRPRSTSLVPVDDGEIGDLARGLEARARDNQVTFVDEARPWLKISKNGKTAYNRKIYHTASAFGFAPLKLDVSDELLQVDSDVQSGMRTGAAFVAMSIALLLFLLGPFGIAAAIVGSVPTALFVTWVARDKRKLDERGWSGDDFVIALDEIDRFAVEGPELQVLGVDGRLRDSVEIHRATGSEPYIQRVMNTHLEDLKAGRLPRTTTPW